MKRFMKSICHTLEDKNVSIPFYTLLGVSVFILIKRLISNKNRHGQDSFRAGSTQFDNKQLGTLSPTNAQLEGNDIQEDTKSREDEGQLKSNNGAVTLLEDTVPDNPQAHNDELVEEETLLQDDFQIESNEIPQDSIIEVINEVTDPALANKGQCKAITKKGIRCRNKADSSGYCFQHRMHPQ
ncbi:MAG: DUF5763 domain-containing protein [Bacteroidota bacterium]|nr:DUF5763 domain-containing protein [Bacteroidota bacterium]MDP4191262.1 DUF5763 domain-containing protein [Bacteroidota bacterium]MDP4194133.1 DUF5763 domain-containing protein [Bacteroidota bacterium]